MSAPRAARAAAPAAAAAAAAPARPAPARARRDFRATASPSYTSALLARAARPHRAARAAAAASGGAELTVREPASGAEFPLVARLWAGEDFRCLGAGARVKKVAFVGVKVYAVALFVEAEKAARELGVRARGGFFGGDDDADYASALVDGAFTKALQIALLRDVEGAQFVAALEEGLRPRLALAGDTASLDAFAAFFATRKLAKGAVLTLVYRPDAVLEVALRAGQEDLSSAAPDLKIASPSLCRALFEVYLGSAPVSPEARAAWAAGARALLRSEEVRRDTRRGGSG